MTHLNITQGSTVETVSAQIVKKLYETASTVSEPLEGETDAAYMSGHISVPHTYAEYVEYLAGEIGEGNNGVITSRIQNPTGRFQDLTIDVTNGIYINFEDSNVESILATNFGDGVGITQTTVASITSFGGNFANSNIVSFNELPQFTNITEINSNNRFNNCTSLTSIDLSNITKISGENGYQRWNFESCTSLEDVGNTQNCTYFGQQAFQNCTSLISGIDLSNATHVMNAAFYGCSALTSIGSLANIQTLGDSVFRGCSGISSFANIALPSLQGTLGTMVFGSCTQIVNVQDLGSITTFGRADGNREGAYWGPFGSCTNLKTLVLPATCTTIGDLTNMGMALLWVKVLSATVPTLVWGAKNVFGYSTNVNSGVYDGRTYPIYVEDNIWNDYLADTEWAKFNAINRLKKLSTFATDFPNG